MIRAIAGALPWRDNVRDASTLLLLAAFLLVIVALVLPPIALSRSGVDVLAVVDITGSMNVRDYKVNGRPEARLAVVKASLLHLAEQIPCPSRIGLALFTERVPFLLFEPFDVCRDFSAFAGAVDSIDWREGWEGDSHISAGLMNAIEMAQSLKSDLLFFTDGQEAPPLPPTGGAPFVGTKGVVRGLIVGVGGYSLSPIPKFDDRGNEIGFWGVDDVPHESRFGPPPADAESRPGYEARNAPFGAVAPKGTEHLSSVREPYLRSLSDETGLVYHHLEGDGAGLTSSLVAAAHPRTSRGEIDLRWLPALLALLATLLAFAFPRLANRAPTARIIR